MTALFSVLWVLFPLLIGFLVKLNNANYFKLIDQLLILLLYAILTITGINISQISQLGQEFSSILVYGFSFLIISLIFNILFIYLLDRKQRVEAYYPVVTYSGRIKVIYSSLKQLFWVLLGMGLGFLLPNFLTKTNSIVTILLMLMLFLIGVQLKSSGLKLNQVLFNRKAIQITVLFVSSCWLVAILVAFLLAIPVKQALAINSGFGWYSLTSVYFNQVYGPFWGAVALINDLGREVLAFLLIPIVMRYSPSSGIAISGATSLDFTLPAIKKAGGLGLVPVAISFGFITTLLTPFFIIIFSQL